MVQPITVKSATHFAWILLLIVAVIEPRAALAQDREAESDSRRFRIGLLVGAHFADFGGTERQTLIADLPDYGLETREHWTVGAAVAMVLTERWSVRVEALLARKGARATDVIVGPDPESMSPDCAATPPGPECPILALQYNLDHTLEYIEVPILLERALAYDGMIEPRLFAGAALAFAIGGDFAGGGSVFTADREPVGSVTATADIDDVTESFDVAVVAGAEVGFPLYRGQLAIGIRYQLGLLAAIDGDFVANTESTGAQLLPGEVILRADTLRNRGFSLTASYLY